MRREWILAVTGAVCLNAGAVLSQRIEPGVHVESVMLAGNTPALHIFPAASGPHPIALLAHGNGASKEMLFRFGEALAAAGFESYSVDEAGFGASPLRVSLDNIEVNLRDAERALGAVDVFVGHSMGGVIGSWSVYRAGFRPKLFIGAGAPIKLRGTQVLLLEGRFEEFFRPASLQARTHAQVVISPWSDHLLEPYDPVLVNAAVRAACAAVGKPLPAAPTAWHWRLAGLVLGIAGAVALMFALPELHPRIAQMRRFIIPGVLLLALFLTLWPWLGVASQLRRIPAHLLVLAVMWLALAVAGRLRLPRWSLPVGTALLALSCLPISFLTNSFISFVVFCSLAISTLWLLPAVAVGRIANHGGSKRDGDIAMAIFASYVIGQFMPLFY